jgi:hypothetical protein
VAPDALRRYELYRLTLLYPPQKRISPFLTHKREGDIIKYKYAYFLKHWFKIWSHGLKKEEAIYNLKLSWRINSIKYSWDSSRVIWLKDEETNVSRTISDFVSSEEAEQMNCRLYDNLSTGLKVTRADRRSGMVP